MTVVLLKAREGESVRKRAHQGFSLIEILVAIALFSTAFLYLLGTLTAANHSVKASADRMCAQDFAERLMEQQKALPPASLNSFQGNSWASFRQNGTEVVLDFTYNVQVNVETVPTTTQTLTRIVVAVDWLNRYQPGQDRELRTVRLETAVGE